MQHQARRSAPQACGERSIRARRTEGETLEPCSAEAAYTVFCREHWPVYSRYAAVVTGDVSTGQGMAQSALEELRTRWQDALRSASPSGYAWDLLTAMVAPYRTPAVRSLYESFRATEVDTLVLRHRLGCSADVGGRTMGLTSEAFELLRRTALMKAKQLTDSEAYA
ncbi:hypothetical protein JHN55_21770 [Streptomyces sp. MBT56]|uniref:hypothetical protein n=1 Tax=unclassified Streptomyces TaxID=2593676 RepID=UPI00190CCC1A|nr:MULTISPECIES: hypothetical protein [unclassified Streptomyces]MBK3559101.1 hypothetical protein [Streptomyces sp. MBT56]MBK3600381.1 hypothetical protein [Streptomyces sp. MBT54]MBK3614596.1 hypothetical protein [Streptomyces sp. MBT98]